jgi:hypothetical protein
MGIFKKNKDINERLEAALKAVSDIEKMPVEKEIKYHEITRFVDTDANHIRELATIGANEHFRSFLFFEREKILSRLESLPVDDKESAAGFCGALKEISIIVRELEIKITQYAEILGRAS